MQCNIFVAFFISCLTFAVSAAPVPESSKGLHILEREIDTPFIGMSEVARAAEPEPESAEARGCRMYTCIWYVPPPASVPRQPTSSAEV
ncbi:hypothetical protein B0H17DRAFT_1215223 [Mycena rosella]|uniref:Uncharacterized protein n=1 Tax=Mycena rosella TaxID=1033263 RepID=A0AAD7G256_MYCRO|nr:hypothetical protein B0H17DRAFT_1215223 [Mycena rosella]